MNAKKKLFVGIDTSNYTTSLSLCTLDSEIIANVKRMLPVSEGERGLRQSDAVFAHVKNLPMCFDELRERLLGLGGYKIEAVGYSAYPRDAEGSYMPCFLVGRAAAEALAAGVGCPTYNFSHQSGHVMAALYSAGRLDMLGQCSFAAFHVSGGTTDLLLVRPKTAGFEIERIGGSLDMNAGQAIDRTGVRMGMRFPCGKEMDELCGLEEYSYGKLRVSVKGVDCNLSGLENLASALYEKSGDRALVSAFCFDHIAETLYRMTENLRLEYPDIPVVFAGGVMGNRRIKKRLSGLSDVGFAEPIFSADNAAGVALLCRRRHLEEK